MDAEEMSQQRHFVRPTNSRPALETRLCVIRLPRATFREATHSADLAGCDRPHEVITVVRHHPSQILRDFLGAMQPGPTDRKAGVVLQPAGECGGLWSRSSVERAATQRRRR